MALEKCLKQVCLPFLLYTKLNRHGQVFYYTQKAQGTFNNTCIITRF